MSAATISLSCLIFCLGQTSSDVWYTRDRHFKIPISIPPAFRQEIKQMVLYVSHDRGSSWPQEGVIGPDDDAFIVHVPKDGEYWYRVAVINKWGKMDPPDIFKAAETHRIVVDTLQPNIHIVSAQRQGDQVVVRWEIQERNPDEKSLKLRYRPSGAANAPWSEPVPLVPGPTGEARANISGAGPLVFRLELKDRAGNFSYDEAEVAGQIATANYGDNKGMGPPPVPPPVNDVGVGKKPPVDLGPPPPPVPLNPPVPANTEPPAKPYKPTEQVAWDSSGSGPRPFTTEATKVQKPIATTDGGFPHHVAETTPAPSTLPPVQYVNRPQITLQYELAHVGPAGVGRIELWITRDDGQTWEPYKQDTTASASMRGGKYTRVLDLPGPGNFGLTLVVYNQVNRGHRPQAGDPPQLRVEVDLTAPEATLYGPEPDPSQRDAVVITWEASDKNLAKQPITLEWSEQPQGPWSVIHASLPNTGKYSWQVPPGVPPYVYLRLRVRDKAGNEGVAVSARPAPIDVSEPEGRLIGVAIPSAEKY